MTAKLPPRWHGVICIDKPEGFTSFDVVAKLRGILKQRRIGHGGTLDPMATGVLPVFLGGATRAVDLVPLQDKAYTAGFTLGLVTDTYDIQGRTLQTAPLPTLTGADIEAALSSFRGELWQRPPMYSAVKINGRKLYQLARQGIEVERPPRQVRIDAVDLIEFDPAKGTGVLSVRCGKGTYIRSLIHDMGTLLGCGAVMSALRRTMALGYTLADCHAFQEIQQAMAADAFQPLVRPVESCFATLPKITLSPGEARAFANGAKLPFPIPAACPEGDNGEPYGVYGPDGFLGLGLRERDSLRVLRLFTLPKD